ncbi:MAG: deoxyhypusine synthase family protein [Candidatus Hydrogenedentota bacterium]|nr:MAG: deoxyhypusine synthase family protein [Candidatus Hydrogenedentota bacterium]
MKKKHGESKTKGFEMIDPLPVEKYNDIPGFIENVFGKSGFNARRLAEACAIYRRMMEEDATICITLAGAMTPIGMSGPLIQLMEKGCVDFIISTGANLYHDLHRAFDMPMVQGSPHADDDTLRKEGLARILDVYVADDETLMPSDRIIVESAVSKEFDKPISSADLHESIGQHILKQAPNPEKSFVAAAAANGVPIYSPSPGDSSIGMNLIIPHLFGKRVPLDPLLDIVETTAIVRAARKNGVVIVGGGAPKNFYMQTQPVLWQILRDDFGGHDFFIQMTVDSPEYGGLSGATPEEAVSWGKIKDAQQNCVVVNSCCSITFPLLSKYALELDLGRERKKLLLRKAEYVAELIDAARNNSAFKQDYAGLIDIS